jgi:2-succinyl-6-hydroxy-2,4-cyclohexadiene-1-carboxylate synthase
VVVIDILGHGKSSSPQAVSRYDIELVAKDIDNVLTALHIDTLTLVGYSMGGRLALTYAMLFPKKINRLILESTSPGLKTLKERQARIEQDHCLADKIAQQGLQAFVSFWSELPLFQSQKSLPREKKEQVERQRMQNSIVGLSGSLKGMGTGSQPSWWDKLEQLSMPVLLLTGALDKKFVDIANEMVQRMPNTEHITVPGVGHAIHIEQPKSFSTILLKYL